MRILIVVFTLLVMFGYGYAEDKNQGFLLDEIAPFLEEKSDPEQEQGESIEVERKQDEQEQNEAEEPVQEGQEGEQVTEEKDVDEQKEVAEPDVLQTQEEKSPAEVESPKVSASREEGEKQEKEGQSKPATDSYKLEDIVDIQLAIALQAKKNELAELEQKLLKIECEKTKLLNEIKKLREPPKKSKTNKPVYVSGSTEMPPGQGMFSTLMVSSVDGMRAYVRDGGAAYYVRKGNRVTRGTIKDITSQGVFVQEETGVVLYPVIH